MAARETSSSEVMIVSRIGGTNAGRVGMCGYQSMDATQATCHGRDRFGISVTE